MKRLFYLLSASICLALFAQTNAFGQDPIDLETSQAPKTYVQKFNEPQFYRTLGIDGGFSYQSSDVRATFGGWGVGLTLEQNLLHQNGTGFLDLGLRGRAMYANSLGFDRLASKGILNNQALSGVYDANVDYYRDTSFLANYREEHAELALEAVLTFNQLRERTGVYLTFFGGVGATYYDVKVDQLNASGKKYDYKSIGYNPSVEAIKALHDGTFETSADGFFDNGKDAPKLNIMPSIGIELGYHFTPRFMVVLGHKAMFTGTNLFDGQRWYNDNTEITSKDVHHYTHLQLKWIVSEQRDRRNEPPKIAMVLPAYNPYETPQSSETVRARVKNVESAKDISLTVNGQTVVFLFQNNELTADVPLVRGENEVIVRATNAYGSDFKKQIIVFKEKTNLPNDPNPNGGQYPTPTNPNPRPTPTPQYPTPNPTQPQSVQPPLVRFIQPSNYLETESERLPLRVRVDNVRSADDIVFAVNGYRTRNFRLGNGELTSEIYLNEGQNTLEVTARNGGGESNDRVTVNYRRPQPRNPTPNYPTPTNPNQTPTPRPRPTPQYPTPNPQTPTPRPRPTPNQIPTPNQNPTPTTPPTAPTKKPNPTNPTTPTVTPPLVSISQPTNGATTANPSVNLTATASNTSDRSQVRVILNGADVAFSYGNGQITANLNLAEGENSVTVRAQNKDGADEKTNRVTFNKPQPKLPIVTIVQPTDGSRTTDPSVIWQARTGNVTDRSKIQVIFNGKPLTFFMNGTEIRGRLAFAEGDNTLTVRASNAEGTDEKSVHVFYGKTLLPNPTTPTKPTKSDNPKSDGGKTDDKSNDVPAPQILDFKASQPVSDPFDPKPPVSVVSATITSVTSAEQIELLVNGSVKKDFTFDAATQQFQWKFEVKSGSYVVFIRARNATGEATKNETVKF